jgi:flagella basal body P-ring formation protein FlgA
VIQARLDGVAARIDAQGARAMPKCSSPLSASWIGGADEYKTAAVSCSKPTWTLYIGVSMVTLIPVPVVRHTIVTGDAISLRDVVFKNLPSEDLSGPAVTAGQIAQGVTARMTLVKGTPVTASNVEVPVVVRAGQPLLLVSREHGVTVEAAASALQNGGYGQAVVVQNNETHRRLTAILVRSAPELDGVYAVPGGPAA